MTIKAFTFNGFQENTYVLFDDTNECIIIDPGCYTAGEEQELINFIETNELKPIAIVNTHNHVDHVLGLTRIRNYFSVPFYCHEGELSGLMAVPEYAKIYGFEVADFTQPDGFLTENDNVKFGNTELEIRFTPGHSPASLCFINHATKDIIAGDVLFQNSIGRTDLPGGDYETLMQSIFNQLLTLDNDYKVYPGHGPSTTIGNERVNNPFIIEYKNNQNL